MSVLHAEETHQNGWFDRQLSKVKNFAALITAERLLAVFFVTAIFFVGARTLPKTLVNVGNVKTGLANVYGEINKSYTNMLSSRGNPVWHKGAYINLNGFMARLLGQRVVNERTLLPNGSLEYEFKPMEPSIRNDIVSSITQMYNAQKERGKHYLFVLAPHKVDKYNPQMPEGFIYNHNDDWDMIIADVEKQNVPVLDLRERVHAEGLDYTSLHYMTDHHWRAETGFWAYGEIVERLTADGVIPAVDTLYTDINNFNVDVYKNHFLGSAGKRVGTTFAGVDDFSLIYTKVDTTVSIKIASEEIDKTGSFYDTFFNHNANELDYFGKDPYDAYGYGGRDYKQYRNTDAPIDMKILLSGDSYGHTVFIYTPLIITTCDVVDMRLYEGDFSQYYAEYAPDIVITLASDVTANVSSNYFK